MAGNGDRSDDDRGDKPVPRTMSATFHLDHVGEVVVLMDSDSLSWKSVRAEGSKDCLGFASFVMTEVSFSNIYATDFINWGTIHEPIIPNSRAHFLSRGSKVMMYRFAVHGFQKSKAQNSPWVPVVYIFGNSDVETCLLWTERINASLSLQPGRPKNLLVFVHPLSGKGKGLRTWEGVAPIFCSAKVRTKVVVTERAGHAFDMMSSITFSELKSYDGVIAVGGDGFFNEILNGFLLSRHNAPYPPAPVEFKNSFGNTNNCPGEGVCNSSSSTFGPSLDQGQDQEPLLHIPEAMDSVHKDFRAKDGSCNQDRDATFSIPHEWFRFGIIPAGSTDAIVICTTGTRDAATSALQIILGKRRHLDIAQVVRWKTTPSSTDAPSVRYAASFVGYGFYGDVIIESEKYRWMGPKRYDYAGTKVFLKHKSYEAEVAYVDVETVNPPAGKASTAGGTRQWWRLPKAQDRVTCSVKCPVCDAKTNSCSDTGDLKWLQCKGRFLSVGAAVISCRNERSPDGLVADAHLGDGFMHLILVKDCPHPLFLWHLTQLARKGGHPLNLDFVEHHKTTAFTFSSASNESTWNLDGESFPACQLSAQVFRVSSYQNVFWVMFWHFCMANWPFLIKEFGVRPLGIHLKNLPAEPTRSSTFVSLSDDGISLKELSGMEVHLRFNVLSSMVDLAWRRLLMKQFVAAFGFLTYKISTRCCLKSWRGILTMEIYSVVEEDVSSILSVAVAVNGSRNSKFALKWALDKFVPEGRILFKILHVRPKITSVPTPMGNFIPISSVRDEVAAAYRKEVEWQTNSMLLPFKQMCTQRQVEAEAVVIEANDVAAAISDEVINFSITTLVIGAPSHNIFTRKFRGREIASRISECIPHFCTLYVISKGKLCSVKPSTSDVNDNNNDERHDTSHSSGSESNFTLTTQTEESEASTSTNGSFVRSSSLPMQRYQALLAINQAIISRKPKPVNPLHHRHLSLPSEVDVTSSDASCSDQQYDGSVASSFKSTQTDNPSYYSGQTSTSDTPTDSSVGGSKVNLDVEIEKLRIELRHVRGMYAMAKNETAEASQQLDELGRRQMEEKMRLWELSIQEQKARELARQEKERTEAAKREADFLKECAESEALERKEAETRSAREAKENQKLERSLISIDQNYKNFSWEEIVSSTSSFSDALKIGMGAYGMVYKCNLGHAAAAVKVLHSSTGHTSRQFQQELEVLSRIRHPHLLVLYGACPNHGCLVYEFMENGSLEDRLLKKNNTLPIPWYHRFRIAWEVASALAFLHNSKPKSIVHRDLKPSNILLDRNFVSKIGDVGLSTLLPTEDVSLSTIYKDTAPVGTLCYIDPEYQRSGLVSPKSDLYAYGIVILQLLTAKPPMGLAHFVESAVEEHKLGHILDSEAGSWPLELAQELAILGLCCTELRGSDRPDLETQVLPVLERLKELAGRGRDLGPAVQPIPPSHFICPILQDVMNDPCVSADGYTYDRAAIEIWLNMNDISPMTNAPLSHKHLVPNYSLLSAIMQWKSKNQQV
ncbi:hypothetical protein H6P81_005113 [Aristolochia fimbriata]|uniref:RING-type E3 ubiquitin transferase n=1 Tax=Aristolochia fimbriata TaxID=158543 RepID=A0AAV7EUL2_ARIFI|nr:hypothetical protein H6P81_005113 [Aristolochia fimbriata]